MPVVVGRDCRITVRSTTAPVQLEWLCDCGRTEVFYLAEGCQVLSNCPKCGEARTIYRPVDTTERT